MTSPLELIGKKFGRLTVKSRAENSKNGHTRWLCLCDCGEEVTYKGSLIKNSVRESCGCLA